MRPKLWHNEILAFHMFPHWLLIEAIIIQFNYFLLTVFSLFVYLLYVTRKRGRIGIRIKDASAAVYNFLHTL